MNENFFSTFDVSSDDGDLRRDRLEVGWVGRSPESARALAAARARRHRDPGQNRLTLIY
jgi:hypothetical protein